MLVSILSTVSDDHISSLKEIYYDPSVFGEVELPDNIHVEQTRAQSVSTGLPMLIKIFQSVMLII